MLASPNASMREGFNQIAYAITDILHFAGGRVVPGAYNAYYGVDWKLGLPSALIRGNIGATRGLTVYTLFNMGVVKWQGKGDPKGAVAAWEQLLKTNPDYPEKARVLELIERAKQHSKA